MFGARGAPPLPRPRWLCFATFSALLLAASAAPAAPFEPSTRLSLRELEAVVERHNPSVEAARLEARVARAEVRQSRLLPNPELDVSWGTIPIGKTNPEDLREPFANVPNYGVGLSYTFLLGKRGPRTAHAEALASAAEASLRATTRSLALELAQLLGELAAAKLKLEGMRQLLEDGAREVELAEARVASGLGTPLELDRLRIDVSRTEQVMRAEESGEVRALASCSALVGSPCRAFRGVEEARGFLEHWFEQAAPAGKAPEERPDLRALTARERAAQAEQKLGSAAAIPDPTLRVGYLRDQFIESGNQKNSLNVTLTLPLPIFDHGQAAVASAEQKRHGYAELRAKVMLASNAKIPMLARRLELERARQRSLSSEVMPRARSVLEDVNRSAEGRLIPLSDVIQARRAVSELLVVEADAYSDAFATALELLAETSPQ